MVQTVFTQICSPKYLSISLKIKQIHLHQHVTMAHNKPTQKQQSDIKSMLTDSFLGEPMFVIPVWNVPQYVSNRTIQ